MLWLFDRARPLGLIPLPRDTAQSPSPCEIARVIMFLSFLRNSSAISTVYLCQKNYIRMFLGKKINEQCISIFSNLIPKLTWACFVVFIVSHLWFFCVCLHSVWACQDWSMWWKWREGSWYHGASPSFGKCDNLQRHCDTLTRIFLQWPWWTTSHSRSMGRWWWK